VPDVRRALLDAVFSGVRATEEMPVVTRARQVRCLERAVQHTARFRRVRAKGVPSEVAATHLQDATLALEDLLGAVSTEDVLSAVFSDFCVGK
jgi:tRNA modification GTPase